MSVCREQNLTCDWCIGHRSSSLPELPFLADESSLKDLELSKGYQYVIEICNYMKLKCCFAKRSYGGYGALVNGTWDGYIGEIIAGGIDTTTPILTPTAARSEVADFSEVVDIDDSAIIMHYPPYDKSFSFMVYPFQPYVWIGLMFAAVLVATLFCVLRQKLELVTPLLETFAYFAGRHRFTEQPIKKACMQTFFAAVCMFGFLVTKHYEAGLESRLIVPPPKPPVRDVDHLASFVAAGVYKIATRTLSITYFSREVNEKLHDALKVNPPHIYNSTPLTDLLLANENYVYFGTKAGITRLVVNNPVLCDLLIIPEPHVVDVQAFAFRKGYPLLPKVSEAVSRLKKTGIGHYLTQSQYTDKDLERCQSQGPNTKETPMEIMQLRLGFVMLIVIAGGIGCAVLGAEILLWNSRRAVLSVLYRNPTMESVCKMVATMTESSI